MQAPLGLPTALLRGAGALAEGAVLRLLIKVALSTLAVFVALGGALLYALDTWLASLGVAYGAELGALAALLVTVLAGWLLFRIVALAILQFFADDVVVAVERRFYADAHSRARKLGLAEEVRIALGGAARALLANLVAAPFALALLFTGIGTAALFWAVNAWLLGRELVDMVWLRHRPTRETPAPVSRAERFLLGGAIAALMFVPFANLIAPVLGAAAATHLVHGRGRALHAV
ncbi:EI24 domain-containing protein [Croceibacterium aestuarii]|uniref:EI24 domain-containing protein n=1 Tax=Croceibacterium aestuarii TaxID=3064139 RepID=UPI00272DE941|nr:EI24 domain-containing protein [Croceibacterium sp. D39]